MPDYSLRMLKVIGLLGNGAFGTVNLVCDVRDSTTYALKSILKSKIQENGLEVFVENETSTLSALDHPFLVRLFVSKTIL